MCDTCGCGDAEITYINPENEQEYSHTHAHGQERHHTHDHDHHHSHEGREIEVQQDVLSRNNLLAERNRGFLQAKEILTLNLVSSPGAGKTTLLEKTITALKQEFSFSVIEGDQQTLQDARRIQATGSPVLQINTGQGCHLDAHMIQHAIKELKVKQNSILMIENVGNLVCPALFDLGEAHKVVIISVTEGDDKPLKYPNMFEASDLCIINKIDLLPYVDFDLQRCKEYALKVNPKLSFAELSARNGEGMEDWYAWLRQEKTRLHEAGL